MAFSCHFGIATSLQAEARAMVFGIHLCLKRGYSLIRVESESLMRAFICTHVSFSRRLMRYLVFVPTFISFTLCFREANHPADALANQGSNHYVIRVYSSYVEFLHLVMGEVRVDVRSKAT